MQTTQNQQRPAFELEPYEDEALPEGERLTGEQDLVGHKIAAMVFFPSGRCAHGSELVMVTETRCWLVLKASTTYGCDETPNVEVSSGNTYRRAPGEPETLHDYLSAIDMLHAGLCGEAEYRHLQSIEQERAQAAKNERAAKLRMELAALEGGAS